MIAFSDIEHIEKRMTAMFIPNAIEIFLKDGTSHFFGSFVFRDNVYKILLALFSLHAKARGALLLEINNGSPQKTPEKPTLGSTTNSHTDESSSEEDDGYEEEDENDQASIESEKDEDLVDTSRHVAEHVGATVMARGKHESKNEATPSNTSGGAPAGNNNTEDTSKKEGPSSNQPSGGNGSNNDEDKNNNNDNQSGKGHHYDVEEDEDEDEEVTIPEEDSRVSGLADLPANDFFYDAEKYKPKEVLTETLPVNFIDAWCLLKSDNIEFQLSHHKSREETNAQYTAYTKYDSYLLRKVTFVSPVNNSLGPKSTRMECMERSIMCKGKKRIITQICMSSLDVPFGDTFRIQNYWIFDDVDGKSCTLKLLSGVVFIKSSLFKWKIEEASDKESKNALNLWMTQAKEAINAAKSKGNLQSLKKSKPKKKKSAKEIKKKRKKTVQAPAMVPAVSTGGVPLAQPFALSAPPPAVETEQDTLTKVLSFLFNIPNLLTSNVSLPVWLLLTIIVTLIIFTFSQQYTMLETIKSMENHVQSFKLQTVLFEQELNHLGFNLAKLNTTELDNNTSFIQNQLSDWLKSRNELYKTQIDNELLHSLLYELSEIKQMLLNKDPGG